MKVIELDVSNCYNLYELHERIRKTFGFPEWYGKNAGLTVAIVLMPLYTYIKGLIDAEMDKIELATKMTNWSYAVIKIRVYEKLPCVVEALQEAEGIVSVKEISDPYSNIQISFKPSMLEKSISNIILEKCDVKSEITESKLRQ